MTDAKIHSIYCLDDDKIKQFMAEDTLFCYENLIEKIMRDNEEFKEQNLKQNLDFEGFNVKIFFSEEVIKTNRLRDFCIPFVDKNADIVKFKKKKCFFDSIHLEEQKHLCNSIRTRISNNR